VDTISREDIAMSAPPLRHLLDHLRRRARSAEPASDRTLLAAYIAGDQIAFTELVRRHSTMVRGVARRVLGDAHAAEDVGQATFLVLARRAPVRAWDESVGGWLHGVAYRLALKARAAARRPIASTERSAPIAPDAEAEKRELQSLLDGELRALPARYRGPLVLCYLEGRTRDEAARQLGVSVAAVKGRLERGRDMLRDRLTRRGCCLGVGLTAAALADDVSAAPICERWADIATGYESVPAAVERLAGAAMLAGHGARWALLAGIVGLAAATAGLAIGIGPDPPRSPVPPVVPGVAAAIRIDRFGEPLPAGARARLGTLRWRAGNSTTQIAFSPDGKTVVAATHDGAYAWDATTGRPLEQFPRLADSKPVGMEAIAFSPDGTIVATGGLFHAEESELRRWDVATGRELPTPKPVKVNGEFPRRTSRTAAVNLFYSPDGKTIAGQLQTGRDIPLWEAPSGKLLARLSLPSPAGAANAGPSIVYFVGYAQDGRTLYTVAGHRGANRRSVTECFVWDTATAELKNQITLANGSSTFGHAISPDGILASEATNHISLTDLATGREIRTIDTAGRMYVSLVYANHGKMLVGRWKDGVDFYDVKTGEQKFSFKNLTSQGGGGFLYADPCGSLVALSRYGLHMLRIWDAATGRELTDTDEFADSIASLAIAADGRTLLAAAGRADGRVRAWNIQSGKSQPDAPVQLPTDPSIGRSGAELSPNGAYVAWLGMEPPDAQNGGGLGRRGARGQPAIGPTGLEMGYIAAIVDVATGKSVQTIKAGRNPSSHLAWSPDGKTIAVAGTGVKLWNPLTGAAGAALTPEIKRTTRLAFSPDGETLATATVNPPSVVLWSVKKGIITQTIPLVQDGEKDVAVMRANAPSSMTFTADGQTLAVGCARSIRRWELKNGKELPPLDGPPDGVAKCIWSPDGQSIYTGGNDGSVGAWDAASGHVRRSGPGHRLAVTSMVLTPDGKTLITGSADTTILIWDIASW
jgi:RNA polymerase sigma factor (sigma-70 family)